MAKYWLMKTEPSTFSWDHLMAMKNQTTPWDGVRNYQARNLMRDEMKVGDGVLFYHSSCTPPGVAGTAKVVRAGYPDPTQFDAKSKYYDPRSSPDQPRWFLVDVRADRRFKQEVPLAVLRETPGLEDMALLRRGMRLSVQPVSAREWKIITKLGGA